MLAVWCLVFAAVGERLAVSGDGRSTLLRDASLWDWFSPEERGDSSDIAVEVAYPKRLVQQMESEEEMSHGYLDTRMKNTTGGTPPVHLAQSCFQVETFGHTFTLDLELNHNLLSSDYVERHFHQDGKPSQSMVVCVCVCVCVCVFECVYVIIRALCFAQSFDMPGFKPLLKDFSTNCTIFFLCQIHPQTTAFIFGINHFWKRLKIQDKFLLCHMIAQNTWP
uniref:Peptidase M12B propeptide domain-containing protein n=1 Tax=Oncorhynchus kisutch TaxID=8019 RepID=A0A8C7K9Y9_ONCKI